MKSKIETTATAKDVVLRDLLTFEEVSLIKIKAHISATVIESMHGNTSGSNWVIHSTFYLKFCPCQRFGFCDTFYSSNLIDNDIA